MQTPDVEVLLASLSLLCSEMSHISRLILLQKLFRGNQERTVLNGQVTSTWHTERKMIRSG